MYLLTLWLGKFIIAITRLAGNSGVAIPGYIIERINRRFLDKGLSKLPKGLIIISGTNGKTTTTKMIADVLDASGIRVLTNKSGSNFVRSIISLIVDKSTFLGKLPYDIAIIEQDEAYAARLIEQHKPRGVVVLNVMRDQMDRFGEIDTTAKLLEKVTEAATDFVVLNGHDPRISVLNGGAKRLFFGVSPELAKEFPNDDDWHGETKHFPNTANDKRTTVTLTSFSDHEATYKLLDLTITLHLKATGQHNFLNAAAALTTLRELLPNEPIELLSQRLENVEAAFGRGEELTINGTQLRLQLVKNPGSFTQALKLANKQPYDCLAIVINDDHADSRDVSWLWDVDFSILEQHKGRILTGGTRAYDMALRLKYDELKTDKVTPNNKQLISSILSGENKKILLYCTYTAMWQLRRQLIRQGHAEYIR